MILIVSRMTVYCRGGIFAIRRCDGQCVMYCRVGIFAIRRCDGQCGVYCRVGISAIGGCNGQCSPRSDHLLGNRLVLGYTSMQHLQRGRRTPTRATALCCCTYRSFWHAGQQIHSLESQAGACHLTTSTDNPHCMRCIELIF